MGAGLTSHWMQLGAADRLVDDLIASKAERISLVLDRSPPGGHQRLPTLVQQMLERW